VLLEKEYTPDPTNARYAGTDCAKQVDRTVCTVLERSGAELIAIDWLELEGTNYEEQADLIAAFLKEYKPVVNLVDATATQDMIVDMLANRCRGICHTEGFKFTAESADQLWKIYEREIHQGRLRYIKARPKEPEALTRSRNRFIEEHQDVKRVLRANKLKLTAPNRRGAHDDYVASAALGVYAAITEAAGPQFKPISKSF
jgi:electron transfer flavoprotein alpha subunit